MDTLSHGLWGGVAFGRRNLKIFALAVLIGMGPDLLSFGPHFFQWALSGFVDYPIEPGTKGAPAIASLPDIVFVMYNITHSLVVWGGIFVLLWLLTRHPPWLWAPWGLHILLDIPTHTTRYFPTPFLWPFDTPYVEGIRWAQREFLIGNYVLLFLVLSGLLLWRSWRHKSLTRRRAGSDF